MSANNTFSIPTAEEVAAHVVARLADMGMVVPSCSLTIDQAAEHLQIETKQVRKLVELRRLKAGNTGTGEKKCTLRFSLVELERFLRGE